MEDSFQIPLSPSPSETPLDDFIIDDLLNIPNDDTAPATATPLIHGSSSTDSSSSSDLRDFQNNGGGIVAAVAAATGGSSSSSTTNDSSAVVVAGNRQFAAEFGVPLEDLAELEWLSNFVEDSFSSTDEGLHKLQLAQGFQARPDDLPYFQPDASRPSPCPSPNPTPSPIPAKARSKRSRPAPGNWTSRLLVVSPPVTPTTTSSSDSFDTITACMAKKPLAKRSKKEGGGGGGAGRGGGGGADGEGRRCLHCATDKTPQWRTGPMGPKTLCNACGVRYKSGRLVPEYRPAASPTFMLTKHSNSHRKVLELRRQKEMIRAQPQHHQHQPFMNHHHHHHQQHQQPSMIFDASSNREDYLIHQHVGPDFRHLI